jgi:signal transduction histidine kinase
MTQIFNRPGIHFRLLVTAFCLIFSAIFVFGLIGESMVQSFIQDRFQERNRSLTHYLAANVELGILIENRQMLKRLANNLLKEEDVVEIRIYDRHDRILALEGEGSNGDFTVVEAPVYSQEMHDVELPSSEGKQEETVIGRVCVVFSLEDIDNVLFLLQKRFVLLGSSLLSISLLVFYLFSHSLVSPIKRLAETARKVASGETKIRAYPEKLPETRDLARAFNAMLDSLDQNRTALERAYQEMYQQKTMAEFGRFAMIIAHEVKNPLGIIKSSMDILKKDNDLSSSSLLVEYIEDEVQRLNRLIEDFLAFSKPLKPTFSCIDPFEILEECIAKYEMQIASNTLQIRLVTASRQDPVQGDANLLHRVFVNLLKNGAEANNYRGVLRVKSLYWGNWWVVDIEDQGSGIDPDLQERIFEPFFTTRSQGTGLGLAYVSQVIHAHGGEVEVLTKLGTGTLFRVHLPVQRDSNGVTYSVQQAEIKGH